VIAAVLVLAACRIENRAPAGSLRDDEAIRGVVTSYYRVVAAAEWTSVRSLFADDARIRRGPSEGGSWRTFDSPEEYSAWLELGASTPLEPVRVEPRQDGDFATVWVVTRRAGTTRGSAGSDHFQLRRIAGAWRIISFVSVAAVPQPGAP